MSNPYRSPQIVPDKPKMGLIPAKKKAIVKVHQCDLPYLGMFRWFFFWLPTIREGSLFRCSCGEVHKVERIWYGNGMDYSGSCLTWIKHPFEVWLEAGGKE